MDNKCMYIFSLFFCFQQYGYITFIQKINKVSLKSLCDVPPKRKTLLYTRINGFKNYHKNNL